MDYEIAGVNVTFPFKPYDCQTAYMEEVITALQTGKNALLESPTGTGKTLSLLCSSLAWQETAIANRQGFVQQQEVCGSLAGTGQVSTAMKEWCQKLSNSAGVSLDTNSTPKIIFSSRTHSQLSQAMQELKQTAYKTRRAGIIGSRDQLCIHPDIRKLDNNQVKMQQCRIKVQTRTCEYYNRYEQMKPDVSSKPGQGQIPGMVKMTREMAGTANILDIEELVTAGQKKTFCPYYMSRELKQDADIIFMPYNYLLDAKIRKLHNVELEGNVLIFDEAHNIEKVCEESSSARLSSMELSRAAEELAEVIRRLIKQAEEVADLEEQQDNDTDKQALSALSLAAQLEFDAGQVVQLQTRVLALEKALDALNLESFGGDKGMTKSGEFLFDWLGQECDITFSTCKISLQLIDKIIRFTSELSSGHSGVSGSISSGGLVQLSDFLSTVFSAVLPLESVMDNDTLQALSAGARRAASHQYKVHIREEFVWTPGHSKSSAGLWDTPRAVATGKTTQRVLNYWCFASSLTMKQLVSEKPRSIILTSGTLYPLETFKDNMGLIFDQELQNSHVITEDQIWVGTVSCGPDGTKLNSNYENRESRAYQNSLGQTIVNFARQIPHGLLVFFPSYSLMSQCIECWKGEGLYHRIIQQKPLLQEPRKKTEFQDTIDLYNKLVCSPEGKGALLVAVCRGKVSEGLDFADHYGRAVLIIGLPFPPFMDPWVKLKMAHMDERRLSSGRGVTGRQWYSQEAWRAVNQAVGRVIRHCNDYGAIILCDERFCTVEAANQLPTWLRHRLHRPDNFGVALRELTQFFRTAVVQYPTPNGPALRRRDQTADETAADRIAGAFEFRSRDYRKPLEKSAGTLRACDVEYHLPGLPQRAAKQRAAEKADRDALLSYWAPLGDKQSEVVEEKVCSVFDRLKTTRTTQSADDRHLREKLELKLKRRCEKEDNELERKMRTTNKKMRLTKNVRLSPAESTASSARSAPGSSGSTGSEKFHEYKLQVKKVLSDEQYLQFQKLLLQYKKSDKLETNLLKSLANLFFPHSIKLFTQLYSVIRSRDKEYFSEFCSTHASIDLSEDCSQSQQENVLPQTTVTTVVESVKSEQNEQMGCSRCSAKSSDVILLYVKECQHRACFNCWKQIVEHGNRRCPTCHVIVKRRNLVKVVNQNETS